MAALSVSGALAGAENAGPAVAPGGSDLAVVSVTAGDVPGPGEIRPHILGGFNASTRGKLTVAFRIAAQRLRGVPECAGLFSGLGADGLARLEATRYQSVVDTGGDRVCGRGLGAAAFTVVNSPRTIVCPSFDRLTVEDAAVIVLHEALHFAGRTEWPLDPDAPHSGEINRIVRVACQL